MPAIATATDGESRAKKTRRQLLNPLRLRGYFAVKLPLALFAGLRVRELTDERCAVSVPYNWRTTNPFRSTYFAAQAMAAELSTGAPALLAVRSAGQSVAMLVVGMSADFEKKATASATFVYDDVAAMHEAVRRAISTGEPQTVEATSVGTLPDGSVVARFGFTWSFKARATER